MINRRPHRVRLAEPQRLRFMGLAVIAALSLTACGGSGPSPFSGTVFGARFTPVDARWTGTTSTDQAVAAYERPGGCADYQAGVLRALSRRVGFELFLRDGTQLTAGTTMMVSNSSLPPPTAAADMWHFDSTCDINTIAAVATGGTVTVIDVSPASVDLKFNVLFNNGEAVSGQIHAAACDGPVGASTSCL